MEMPETEPTATKRPVWNAGRPVGAKRALKPKQIWEIRFYLRSIEPVTKSRLPIFDQFALTFVTAAALPGSDQLRNVFQLIVAAD